MWLRGDVVSLGQFNMTVQLHLIKETPHTAVNISQATIQMQLLEMQVLVVVADRVTYCLITSVTGRLLD